MAKTTYKIILPNQKDLILPHREAFNGTDKESIIPTLFVFWVLWTSSWLLIFYYLASLSNG